MPYLVDRIALKIELFRDLPPRIRVEMIKKLKREILFTGYILTVSGDIGSKMFITTSGKLILLSENSTKVNNFYHHSMESFLLLIKN